MTRKTNEFSATDVDGRRYTVSVLTQSFDGVDGGQLYHAVQSLADRPSYSGRDVKRLTDGTYLVNETGAVLTAELSA